MIGEIKEFLLRNRAARQTVAKNTLWLSIGNIGGRLLRAIVVIYAARILGAAEWGVFSYALSLVALLTIFTDLGVNGVVTRETTRMEKEEERGKLLTSALILKTALLVVGVVVVFIVARISTLPDARLIIPIASLILIFDTFREFGFSLTRAAEKMEKEALLFIGTNVAIMLFGFTALLLDASAQLFTLGYALGTGLGTIATLFVVRKQFQKMNFSSPLKSVKPLFFSALPFGVAALLGGVMINTDILVIGAFRSPEEIGFYSANLRLMQILYLIPGMLATSIFPLLSRLAKTKSPIVRPLLEKTLTAVLAVGIPVAVGGAVTASGIIGLIFGAQYLPAATAFQVLLFTLFLNFPAVVLSNALFAHNQQKSLLAFAALGGLTNLFLDLLLIPAFGIVGSSWATLLAQIVSTWYLWTKMKQIQPFEILPHLSRIAIGSVAMGIVALLLTSAGVTTIITVITSGLIYLLLLYLLKEPLIKELRPILQRNA